MSSNYGYLYEIGRHLKDEEKAGAIFNSLANQWLNEGKMFWKTLLLDEKLGLIKILNQVLQRSDFVSIHIIVISCIADIFSHVECSQIMFKSNIASELLPLTVGYRFITTSSIPLVIEFVRLFSNLVDKTILQSEMQWLDLFYSDRVQTQLIFILNNTLNIELRAVTVKLFAGIIQNFDTVSKLEKQLIGSIKEQLLAHIKLDFDEMVNCWLFLLETLCLQPTKFKSYFCNNRTSTSTTTAEYLYYYEQYDASSYISILSQIIGMYNDISIIQSCCDCLVYFLYYPLSHSIYPPFVNAMPGEQHHSNNYRENNNYYEATIAGFVFNYISSKSIYKLCRILEKSLLQSYEANTVEQHDSQTCTSSSTRTSTTRSVIIIKSVRNIIVVINSILQSTVEGLKLYYIDVSHPIFISCTDVLIWITKSAASYESLMAVSTQLYNLATISRSPDNNSKQSYQVLFEKMAEILLQLKDLFSLALVIINAEAVRKRKKHPSSGVLSDVVEISERNIDVMHQAIQQINIFLSSKISTTYL